MKFYELIKQKLLSPLLGIVLFFIGTIPMILGGWVVTNGPGNRLIHATVFITLGSLFFIAAYMLLPRGEFTRDVIKTILYTITLGAALLGALTILAIFLENRVWQGLFSFASLTLFGGILYYLLWHVVWKHKKKRYPVLILAGLFVLYTWVFGGGILIEKSPLEDIRWDGINLAEVKLTDSCSARLTGRPTTNRFHIPFFFHSIHTTYPIQIWSTGFWCQESEVLVTEVVYHCSPNDAHSTTRPSIFSATSWEEIVITEPGEWIVETKGYLINRKKEKMPIKFPVMTIRLPARNHIFVKTLYGLLWTRLQLLVG